MTRKDKASGQAQYEAISPTQAFLPNPTAMLWRLFNSGKGIERYKHGDQPAWALVTGSSDGIGKEIATELLSRGFNVFLHGRNTEKLTKLKTELSVAFSERFIEYIVADASDVSVAQMANIVQQVEGRNLTVLVNNAAWVGGKFDSLQDMDYDSVETAVNINIRFFTHLTRILLPILSTKQPALIINVTSLVAKYPMGYLSIYSGTKAYMVALSRALVHEFAVESRKIEVLVAEIHNSQSSSNKSPEAWHTPSAKTMGKAVVDSVGNGGSGVVVTPYLGHEFLGKIVGLMGRARVEKIGTDSVIKTYKS